MLLGLLFAILTGLAWVLVGAVVGLAEKRGCGSARMQLVGSMYTLTLSAVAFAVGPAMPEEYWVLSPVRLIAAASLFACGFLNYWMIITLGAAMARGPNGPAWTITQSGFIFPFAMGVLSGNTRFTWSLAAGFALVLANVIVTGLAKGDGEGAPHTDGGRRRVGWFPLALLAFVFCGTNQCAASLVSYLPDGVRPESLERLTWVSVGSLSGWCLHAIWKRMRNGLPPHDPDLRAKYIFLAKICAVNSAVCFAASLFFHYEALDRLEAAGAAAIGYPVMVVSCFLGFAAYSALVLRERLSRLQWIAFAAGILGIVLLSASATGI